MGAFGLLTRLPLGWVPATHDAGGIGRGVWAYPLVGAVVGGISGSVYLALAGQGMPPTLAACGAVTAGLLATGALHEDGLADTADGFGGGRNRARKLEIMRDSRIGTYGALALGLCLIVRVGALASLAAPGAVFLALVAANALGRGTIVGLLALLPPARPDGLGASVGRPSPGTLAVGLLSACVAAFLLLPGLTLASLLLSALACIGLAALARAQVGGHTGDVLGAGAVTTECAVLCLLTMGHQ